MRAKVAVSEVEKLRKKIVLLTERNGMKLTGSLQEDFATLFCEGITTVQERYSPGTFQRMFWDQQADLVAIRRKPHVLFYLQEGLK